MVDALGRCYEQHSLESGIMSVAGVLIAFMLAGDQVPSTSADLVANARSRCEKDWSADFSMQEFCFKQQIAGAQSFADTFKGFQGDKKRLEPALEKCLKDWSEGDNVDWNMASFCAREQVEALTRLSR